MKKLIPVSIQLYYNYFLLNKYMYTWHFTIFQFMIIVSLKQTNTVLITDALYN